jgi:hypothetical protein
LSYIKDNKTDMATSGISNRVLQVDVGACTAEPVITEQVSDLNCVDIFPSTRMLSGSDDLLYFGTTDGFLASYNPSGNSIIKQIDLTDNNGEAKTRVVGFLSEPIDGFIMGVVADTLIANTSSGVRPYI